MPNAWVHAWDLSPFIAVLHTWGSALTHHPHLHCIVPGGGLSPDGTQWVPCKPGFFLPVRVLSRYFQRVFLEQLNTAHRQGRLRFYGQHQALANAQVFANFLQPLRHIDWVVYAKRPFAGPEAVLEYLSRYTHRVAISNRRLVAYDQHGVTFKWKDYRAKHHKRYKTMTLKTEEFIRRFLIHVLPKGFHRIRHFGLLANPVRKSNLKRLRTLLNNNTNEPDETATNNATDTPKATFPCPTCGAAMTLIETLTPTYQARAPPL